MESFSRVFHVGWGDMDFNAHMRNTAYLDMAADVRMMFLSEHGFSMRDFERLKIGPVMFRDDLEYFLEMHLLQSIRVTYELAGQKADASRFRMRNEFFREDGKLVARVTSSGGWLDLQIRKLIPPPGELLVVLQAIPRAKDFVEL